jgi:hypothetical protein
MSKMVATGYSVVSKQYKQRGETTSFRVVGRFKCQRCDRNADKECSLLLTREEVLAGQSSGVSLLIEKIQELAPSCDCDMMRCRIGTEYMRRHRLVMGVSK